MKFAWGLAALGTLLADPLSAQAFGERRSAVSGLPLTEDQQAIAPQHLWLDIWVDPVTKSIRGKAEYSLAVEGGADVVELELDGRFRVSRVALGKIELPAEGYRHAGGLLSIPIEVARGANGRLDVTVEYEGQPRTAPNAPWDGGFVWATTPGGQPWIATAMQAHGCDLLFPCIDNAAKEIGRVESTIWVPEASDLYAAGNGRLIETVVERDWRGYRWSARQPNIYAIALNIAPYKALERTHRAPSGQDVPLIFYHLPGDGAPAARLLDELAKYLDWFERRVGPYPFADEKAGIAQTPHLGMEHQTINAYGNEFRITDEPYDWLLFHEFAHEWFANQLTHRAPADMWLHEGMASYAEALYLRDIAGEEAYRAKLAEYRPRIASRVAVAPRGAIDSGAYLADDGWGGDIYFKGSWILHTLRELIGDAAFFRSLTRLVYATPDPVPGEIAPLLRDTDEFLGILEEESGRELGWFFEAYLRQPALPWLKLGRDGSILTLEWQLPGAGAFPMPVDVKVGDRVIVAEFEGRYAEVDLGGPTVGFAIDPENKLLRAIPRDVPDPASPGAN
jgi:aminopeptidase N